MRLAVIARYAAALLLFGLATVGWFHGTASHPGSNIPGGLSDATGTIRDYWAASVQHRNPFTFTHDALNGAPQGFARVPATVLANGGVQTAFVWELRQPLGFIGAWNAFLVLGLLATGMTMFALLERLGCTFTASLFGGYVFAFSPYAIERALAGHLGLLQNWVLVLLAGLLIGLGAKRSLVLAAAAGLAIALAFYISAYEGLLAGFMAFVFFLVELVRLRQRAARLRSLVLGGVAYLTAALAMIPIFVAFLKERSTVDSSIIHQQTDQYQYAAKALAYLLPSPRNPLFHWLRGIHPADLTEQTLFFGYVTIALAIAAIVLLRRRDAWLAAGNRRWTAIYMAVLVPAAFLTSFPPKEALGPASIPMPSSAISAFTSFWRVFSRFGLLVGFGLAVLAAFALSSLGRRPGRAWRLLGPVALGLVVLELLPGNIHAFDTTARPNWVAWLATQPRGIVATYPALADLSINQIWYQRHDRQPRFAYIESSSPFTRNQAIRLLAQHLDEPLTAQVLATEGVRYVVVDNRAFGGPPPKIDPSQYTLLKRFGPVRIFSVHAPTVDIAEALKANQLDVAMRQGLVAPPVSYGDGFNPPEQYLNEPSRWLIQDGVIHLDNSGPRMQVILTAEAFSNQYPHVLELVDGAGRVIGRQQVPVDSTSVHFGPFWVPSGRSKLMLVAQPGPVALGPADPRLGTVFLSPLLPRPLPVYTAG